MQCYMLELGLHTLFGQHNTHILKYTMACNRNLAAGLPNDDVLLKLDKFLS